MNIKRLFKREKGFTLVEVLVVLGIIGFVSAVVVGVVVTMQKNTKTFTEVNANQESLVNASQSILRELKASPRITSADKQSITFQNPDGEFFTYLYYDPENPSQELEDGVGGFSTNPDDVPGINTPSLIEIKKVAGSQYSAVKVLVSDVDLEQGRNGLDLFTYYSRKGSIITTPIAPGDLGEVKRIALRIVANDPNRNEPVEIATSITLGDSMTQTNPDRNDETQIEAPLPTTLKVNLPPRTQVAHLSWDHIAGATAYLIYRDGMLIDTTGEDVTQYDDANRPWGTDFRYHVVVQGAQGLTSTNSNSLVARTVPEKPAFININPTAACANNTVARNLDNCLVWTPRTGAVDYRVLTNATVLAVKPTTSHTHSGRNYGDVTPYNVIARNEYIPETNSGGDSITSDPVTLISPPVAPTVSNTHSNGVRYLWWNAVPNAKAYRTTSVDAGVGRNLVWNHTTANRPSSSGNALVDNSVYDSNNIVYTVTASNDAGNSPGTTLGINARPDAPVITGSHSNGDRTISWSGANNATSYQAERTAPTALAIPVSGTSATDTTAVVSRDFTYRARSYNITGYSAWSNLVDIFPNPLVPSLSITDGTNSTAFGTNTVSWNDVANATSYEWKRGSTGSVSALSGNTIVERESANDISWDSRYTYYVRSKNKTGVSDWDSIIGRQPPGPIDFDLSQRKASGQASTSSDDKSQSVQKIRGAWVRISATSSGAEQILMRSSGTSLNTGFYSDILNESDYYVRDGKISEWREPNDRVTYTGVAVGETSGLERTRTQKVITPPAPYTQLYIQQTLNKSNGYMKSASYCAYNYGSSNNINSACSSTSGDPRMVAGSASDVDDLKFQVRDLIVEGTWDDTSVIAGAGGNWRNWNGGRTYASLNYSSASTIKAGDFRGNLSFFRILAGTPTDGYSYGSISSDYYVGDGPKGTDTGSLKITDEDTLPRSSWGQYMAMRVSVAYNHSGSINSYSPTSGDGYQVNQNSSFYAYAKGMNFEGVCGITPATRTCSNSTADDTTR